MAQAKYSPLLASGMFATPYNTMCMGNPMAPQPDTVTVCGHETLCDNFDCQAPGSGDIPL